MTSLETMPPRLTVAFAIGAHRAVYEPPDVVVVKFHGAVRAEEVIEHARRRAVLFAGQPHILSLLNLREVTSATPGARQAMAGLRDPRPQATALLGASFRVRAFAGLIVKAVHLLTGKLIVLSNFEEEPAARLWLGEMRGRLRR